MKLDSVHGILRRKPYKHDNREKGRKEIPPGLKGAITKNTGKRTITLPKMKFMEGEKDHEAG